MRLIDLRCHWLRQYFSELVAFDQSKDANLSGRLGELAGYLSAVSAAGLICARDQADWSAQPDPWGCLREMIVRYQAEFSGRILMGPDDVERWRLEPADGLCWGMIGVGGFGALIRSEQDLDRLPKIFAQGVRIFQPIGSSQTLLGGSSDPGDYRPLSDLGKAFLERLTHLTPEQSPATPRPILDLTGANTFTMGDILSWLESNSQARESILLMASNAAVATVEFSSDPGTMLPLEMTHRIRAMGGTIALGLSNSRIGATESLVEAIRTLESIPFDDRKGSEGIAVSTDFLGAGGPTHDLKNAEMIIKWFNNTFDRATVQAILHDNAQGLLMKAAGAGRPAIA